MSSGGHRAGRCGAAGPGAAEDYIRRVGGDEASANCAAKIASRICRVGVDWRRRTEQHRGQWEYSGRRGDSNQNMIHLFTQHSTLSEDTQHSFSLLRRSTRVPPPDTWPFRASSTAPPKCRMQPIWHPPCIAQLRCAAEELRSGSHFSHEPDELYKVHRLPCTSYCKILVSYNWIGILQSCSKPIKCGQMAIPILLVAGRPFLLLVTSVLLHSLPNRLQSWGGARVKMLRHFRK